jgi:hypothetical protein
VSINDFPVFGIAPLAFMAAVTLIVYSIKGIPVPDKYKLIAYKLILIALVVYMAALFYEVYPYL